MARVTDDDVKAIMDVDPTITDLTPFITIANMTIARQCPQLDETTAFEVERWLAAHYLTVQDQRSAAEGVTGANISFQYKTDLALDGSRYGQTAKSIDYTGGLAAWDERVKNGSAGQTASIDWLGSEDC